MNRRLQAAAEREVRLAVYARATCKHRWQEAEPPRTVMPDGRSYLTRRCPRCGAAALRGTGRRIARVS